MFRRLLLLTLFLAATSTAVRADDLIDANMRGDGVDHVGDIAVIIDPKPTTMNQCVATWDSYSAVLIRLGGGATVKIASDDGGGLALAAGTLTDPGERFEIVHQEPCEGDRVSLRVRRLLPGNSQPLLFATGGGLAAGQIGVITGPQDESGFADVVFTTADGKPARTTLYTDTWLQPADRLVDLVELDHNPETGVSIYGGFLEY